MTSHHSRSRSVAIAVLAVGAFVLGLSAQGTQNPAEFAPDGAVKGSTLSGWKAVGDADWRAQNGELVGTAKAGGAGGWLVMEKGFEDVQLFTNYRCTGACKSGILVRARKTPDGGMKGLFVSLADGEFGSYYLTLDAAGKETARDRIVAPARGGGSGGWTRGGSRGGTGWCRGCSRASGECTSRCGPAGCASGRRRWWRRRRWTRCRALTQSGRVESNQHARVGDEPACRRHFGK